MTQTKLRTYGMNSNKNITFPIGTAVTVQKYSEKLDFENIFGKYKKKGREGFFCLTSSEDLTLEQALETYRKKDSIEKLINSLKNEIEIKLLRLWTEKSIYGALIIGFLAQLIMSLIKYDYKELKKTSVKFIKISLMNLTVTVEFLKNKEKKYIYSNFDPINELILAQNQGIT